MKYKEMTIFLLIFSVSIAGVITGMIVAKRQQLSIDTVKTVVEFTRMADRSLHNVFISGLQSNLPWFAAFSILSFWSFGICVNTVLLFYKGYTAGLASMYLCMSLGLRGVVIGIIGVILPSILLLLLYCYVIYSGICDKLMSSRTKALEKGVFSKTMMVSFVFLLSVYVQSVIQYAAFYKF